MRYSLPVSLGILIHSLQVIYRSAGPIPGPEGCPTFIDTSRLHRVSDVLISCITNGSDSNI
jgi:hypothetical protein